MNIQHYLHPQYHDAVPLSKAPNPQLLPGRRSIKGCPLLRVCVLTAVYVHLGLANAEHGFRVWVTIPGRMSHHFHFSLSYSPSSEQNDVYYSRGLTSSTTEEFSNAYLESKARTVLEVPPNSHNTEDLTVLFNETCTNILDLLAPLKPKVLKSSSHPWFNHHTRALRRECRKAERKWKSDR